MIPQKAGDLNEGEAPYDVELSDFEDLKDPLANRKSIEPKITNMIAQESGEGFDPEQGEDEELAAAI